MISHFEPVDFPLAVSSFCLSLLSSLSSSVVQLSSDLTFTLQRISSESAMCDSNHTCQTQSAQLFKPTCIMYVSVSLTRSYFNLDNKLLLILLSLPAAAVQLNSAFHHHAAHCSPAQEESHYSANWDSSRVQLRHQSDINWDIFISGAVLPEEWWENFHTSLSVLTCKNGPWKPRWSGLSLRPSAHP